MNIVLTNDDGIDSNGLKLLENVLKKYGSVYVFAPATQQSAKGCSITCFNGIDIKKIDEFHYKVYGTPVDCVEAACVILPKIDLLVSGCNNGYNLSNDIMYSGTCGACIQSSFANIPSIAFSIKNYEHFHLIENYAKKALDYIFKNNLLGKNYFLNVNLPILSLKGIKLTKLDKNVYETYYVIKQINDNYAIERNKINTPTDIIYDYNCVNEGYISITPLTQNMFDTELFEKVFNKIN